MLCIICLWDYITGSMLACRHSEPSPGFLGDEADGLRRTLQMGCIEEGLEDVISQGHGTRGQSALARRRFE